MANLGSKTCQIVSELKYESSDPTVDSQVVALAASGADVFFYQATPKFSAQILVTGERYAFPHTTQICDFSSDHPPNALENRRG
jgi:hypothetical protein